MNQYIVIKTMGRGAYGKVKLCLDSQTHELYAIKVVNHSRATRRPRALPGSRQAHSTLDADVVQEIAVMKQLDHPNIVRLVEVIGEAWLGQVQGVRSVDRVCRPAWECWWRLAVRPSPPLRYCAMPAVSWALPPAAEQACWPSSALSRRKHVSAVHALQEGVLDGACDWPMLQGALHMACQEAAW